MPKLQIIVSPSSGISYHRFVNPLSYLDMGPDWTCELLWFGEDEHKIDCDVLWYSKYLVTEPKWLKKLQEKGTKIIVDVDDHWELPPSHPVYKQWKEQGKGELVLENIRMADLVTCSTMRVQETVRQYNKNTVVIPNGFPYGQPEYRPEPIQRLSDKMTFLYSGGSSHYQDVKLMEGKFKRLGSDKSITDKALFAIAGYEQQKKKMFMTPKDMRENNNNFVWQDGRGEWDKMVSVFKQTNSYQVLPTKDLDTYLRHYDIADVALIPLVDNMWNSHKSVLKVCEAATRRIPVICSKVEPYSELIPCEGIMWVDNTHSWADWIKYCIKNPEWTKEQGEKLANWVWEEYNLITINDTRKQVLNSIIK